MVSELLTWMDDHFDHDLTDIVISATVIDRGVRLAFAMQFGPITMAELPELRSAVVVSINHIRQELDRV